jgi:hypothetical protein
LENDLHRFGENCPNIAKNTPFENKDPNRWRSTLKISKNLPITQIPTLQINFFLLAKITINMSVMLVFQVSSSSQNSLENFLQEEALSFFPHMKYEIIGFTCNFIANFTF